MSQEGILGPNSGGALNIQTITGNTGGAVPPNLSNTIFVTGNMSMGITTVGNPGTNTINIVASQASTTQFGTIKTATNAQAAAQSDTNNALTASNITSFFSTNPLPASQGGSGTSTITGVLTGNGTSPYTSSAVTNHFVLVGAPSNLITSVSPSTAGFVLTSNGTLADPSFQTVSASGAITTITGNTGGAEVPSAGNFNILGTGSITVAGSANTETIQLTGLTAHNILLGEGTATVGLVAPTANTGAVLQNNSGADPSYSTATYPSTTTINQILYSSAANTVTGLATANQAVLTTGATGIPVLTALATNGQLIIGSTAGVPAAATLSAGAGITITNGANSITIASTAGGFTWSETSGVFTAVKENGYFLTGASTPTMPAVPTEGDTISFVCDTGSTVTITGNTGQKLRIGTALSASAGTAASSTQGNTVEFVYKSTGTTWIATSVIGTWSVT